VGLESVKSEYGMSALRCWWWFLWISDVLSNFTCSTLIQCACYNAAIEYPYRNQEAKAINVEYNAYTLEVLPASIASRSTTGLSYTPLQARIRQRNRSSSALSIVRTASNVGKLRLTAELDNCVG